GGPEPHGARAREGAPPVQHRRHRAHAGLRRDGADGGRARRVRLRRVQGAPGREPGPGVRHARDREGPHALLGQGHLRPGLPRRARARALRLREDGMRLGLMLGYWMPDPWDPTDLVQEAERLGYESVWTAEAYGSDVFSPLCWVGARTKRIKLGTAIMQISARTLPGAARLAKPLKLIVRPLRADIPIYRGAEGPTNVALATDIAYGWLPLFCSPYRRHVYADSLRGSRPGFEIACPATVSLNDDLE